jgi:diguanylate cyclase (GGDEF)-like protein
MDKKIRAQQTKAGWRRAPGGNLDRARGVNVVNLLLIGLIAGAVLAAFGLLWHRTKTQRDLATAREKLELRRAFEEANAELERRLTQLSLIYQVARSFTSTIELTELLSRISALVAERLKIPHFSIMLQNSDGSLEVKAAYPPDQGTEGICFGRNEGVCGRAAQERIAVYLPNVEADTNTFLPRAGSILTSGSLLAVPMIHQDAVLGVLNFQRPEVASFAAEEIEALTAIADQAALAVKNANLHQETVALAITDPLTGVSNRRQLFTRLDMEVARANRFGTPVSVLMIDIDQFKSFNDSAGHRAGDQLLRQVAELMRKMIRKVDTLGRYGGDEFLLLLPQVGKGEAAEVAEKLRKGAEAALFDHANGGGSARITVSVGVASFPADATTQEQLIDMADGALYASKRGGRNQVTAYSFSVDLQVAGKLHQSTAERTRTALPLEMELAAGDLTDREASAKNG